MMFVGVTSYSRPLLFKLSIFSIIKTNIIKGVIAIIDVNDIKSKELYLKTIKEAKKHGLEVIGDVHIGRRGSTVARNKLLEYAVQLLNYNDILILFDDDYICPGSHAIEPIVKWLNDPQVGLVGGNIINIIKRKIDPDFYLNIFPLLADSLTKITGFIFINTKHGPRYVEYTTPLMAIPVSVIHKGIRYDEKYQGTGYREESDFQYQIRKLGYKIIYDPNFYVYHLAIEYGGNRNSDVSERFYWKSRNNLYFIKKHKLGIRRMASSFAIIAFYAAIYGKDSLRAVIRGFKDGLRIKEYSY